MSTQSMDIPAGDFPATQSVSVSSIDEDIEDESTMFLTAPKVAYPCIMSLMKRPSWTSSMRERFLLP